MRLRSLFIALVMALPFIAAAFAANEATSAASPGIDIAIGEAVLDLGPSLAPRDEKGSDGWFMLQLRNGTPMPAARILQAADSPSAGLALLPRAGRAVLVEATASGAGVVEAAPGFAANAFRVVLPPSSTVSLALHFQDAPARPTLLAWVEPALIQYERGAAILASVVSGLLAASFGFALGTAILSGTLYAGTASAFLATLFIVQLAATGNLDTSLAAGWSGPHALVSFTLAAMLAAGVRLVDRIAPFNAVVPQLAIWRDRAVIGPLVAGALAYLGMPLLGFLIRILAVGAAAGAAAYLTHCGRVGNIGARRLAPAATTFALVAASAALDALGLFGVNLVSTGAIGGFSAAGALLVAIAAAVPLEPVLQRVASPDIAPAKAQAAPAPALPQRRELEALSAAHQGVFDLDLHTGLISLSAEAGQLLGLPAGAVEIGSETFLSQIHPQDGSRFEDAVNTYRNHPGVAFRLEFRRSAGDGRESWFELRATMTGQAAEAERCLGLIANVSARKIAETAEIRPSETDTLTGLGTRSALLSRLEAMRGELKVAALAVFDLDRFKTVNDSLGRDGGDALLIAFAQRLAQSFAAEDSGSFVEMFRVGGDMFAAVSQNVPDLARFGERIVNALSPPFTVQGRDIYLASSVGMAAGEHAEDSSDLFSQAELALVEAKREGGGRVVLYSSALARSAPQDAIAIETNLRRALEKDEIEVHYQPIVRLGDGVVAGFEALLRWRDPERGLIEPDAFLPQAERCGLILPLGKLVLRRAAEDLARWQKFFPAKPPLSVSVNIAWRQVADDTFARDVALLLRTSGIARRSLHLEVTEGQVMANAQDAEAMLKKLKAQGVCLSIDDFGTGHSSLGRLARLPFDTIKIDKSLLSAARDSNGAKILASIVSLARELRLSVVCEGVESKREITRLKEMGCEYGQGFLLGMPAPAFDINRLLAKAQATLPAAAPPPETKMRKPKNTTAPP